MMDEDTSSGNLPFKGNPFVTHKSALEASTAPPPTQWSAEDIDVNIRGLVRELNALPGIKTIGSCGGHEHPNDEIGQRPLGQWFVTFRVSLQSGGWRSLERIASLYSFFDFDAVTLDVSSNCFGNPSGRSLFFGLEGHGSDPSEVEALLNEIRQPEWKSPIEVIRAY